MSDNNIFIEFIVIHVSRMSRNLRERLQEYETDKKNIIHNIQKLESQIYEFEGSYLKETGAYGNAVKVS